MRKAQLVSATVLGLLLLGVVAGAVFAQSPNVITAEVDRNSLSTDEVLTLTVLVNATKGITSGPALPDLDEFNIIGSSSSTQISLVNGDMRIDEVYRYQLRPTRAGDLDIEPVTVTVNGHTYRTDPIAITITQGTGQLRPPPSSPAPSFPSTPGFPSIPGFPSLPSVPSTPTNPVDPADPPTGLAGQDYFVEADVDNRTPYQGEQVIYTFRFYQAADAFGLLDQPQYEAPAFTGFWHDLQPERGEYTVQTAGRAYRVTQLQTVLFPTVLGEITIDPAVLNVPGSFFSRGRVLRTEPISIDVQPLPPGAPADFQGTVGQFSIQAQVDTTTTKVNDTITLQVTLSGHGNIDMLPGPEWPADHEWRAFDSQAITDTHFENGKLVGSRTFNRLLVPTTAGELTLPAIQYSYFDPQTVTYQTISTQPIVVTVARDPKANPAAPALPVGDSGVASPSPGVMGIRPIKPASATWTVGSPPLTQRVGYWLLWGVPVLLIVGQFGWQLHQKRQQDNVAARRRQGAAKRAKRALREARKNPSQAHSAAGRILTAYIADKLNRPVTGLTQTSLSGLLLTQGTDPDLVNRVQACLMLSEMGSYAPTNLKVGADDVLAETEHVIDRLEKAL